MGTGAGHDGDPVQTTSYSYASSGAGWRFPADPEQQRQDESWTQWRGYTNVTVTTGGSSNKHSTSYWMFQGLDGDRKVIAPSGPSDYKSVTVHGSSAGPTLSLTDSAWLGGRTYEESHRDDGDISHEYVIHNFGFVNDTAVYSGLPDAWVVREDKTYTYDKISTSTSDTATWREGETQVIYDMASQATSEFGLPARAEDDGQIGVSDNSCSTYGYAYNDASGRWMALRDEVRHYADTCANRGSGNQDAYTAILYDGATSVGADVPTDGDPTEVDAYNTASTFTSVKHSYDTGGRILTSTDGNGNTTTTTYTPAAGWPTSGITVTTPTPDVTAQDVYGQSSSKTAFITTTISTPATGLVTSLLDANGQTTTVQYDTAGRPTGVWMPTEQPTTNPASMLFTYTIPTTTSGTVPDSVNGPAVILSKTLQSGSAYLASYRFLDGLGQTREVQAPAADGSTGRTVVSTRYDSSGYTEGVSDPYYNSSGPGSGMVNPATTTLPAYHDLIVDWAGRTTENQLQHLGVSQTALDVHTAYYGDYSTVTPPTTTPAGPITDTYTDVFGNITKLVQHVTGGSPSTITTNYTYDDKNQFTQISDVNTDLTTYTYNWSGQQTNSHDPDAGTTTTGYDAAGNIASMVDANGQTITTLYDALNRATTRWLGAAGTGTKLEWNTYDTATLGKAKPASSTTYNAGDPYAETIDGYDADGRSLGTTITIPSVEGSLAGTYDTTTPTYDAAGHVLSTMLPAVGTSGTTLPAETVTNTYDALGHAATLTGTLGPTTYVSTTAFNNWGPLASRTYGTGTLTAQRAYAWDQATGWLSNITTTVTNAGIPTTAQNDTYGYDNAGNLRETASATGTAQQQCYGYDGLNRLTAAFTTTTASSPISIVANCAAATANHGGGVAPYDLAYTYDTIGLGSLITVVDNMTPTPTTSTYSYPSGTGGSPIHNPARPHAVTSVTRTGGAAGTDSYGYDSDGQQTSRPTAGIASTLTWNPRHQLASATTGTASTSFIYDAAGNRLIRKTAADTVLYLPGQELHLTGTTITPTRYYTSGSATAAMRVGATGNGTLTWLTSDSQNNTQIAVNTTTGNYTQQRYLPFGAQRGAQGPTNGSNKTFLGHNNDPSTGLLQDGARYYDTTLGRFLSPDPVTTAYLPQNLNRYNYATNNPTTYSDPSGLESTEHVLLDGGGSGGMTGGVGPAEAEIYAKELASGEYMTTDESVARQWDEANTAAGEDIYNENLPQTPEEIKQDAENSAEIDQEAESIQESSKKEPWSRRTCLAWVAGG